MVSAIADNHRRPIRRNPRQSRRSSHSDVARQQRLSRSITETFADPELATYRPFAVGGDVDEVGAGVHANRRHHFIALRINDADAVGLMFTT